MDISVVISLYNERESLQELVKGIGEAIAPTGLTYNIIMCLAFSMIQWVLAI